ncbi:MAG: diacylglyceryl transferase, partial [Bacteroidetes bacterium]|nr:diacylglyceryl transferase [Bacteroidota bacterium]
MDKLKERWGITSNFQVILIIIVFSINGSFAAWVAKQITEFIGISPEENGWLVYLPIRILLIFPI